MLLYVLWEEVESKCMGTETNKEDSKFRKVRQKENLIPFCVTQALERVVGGRQVYGEINAICKVPSTRFSACTLNPTLAENIQADFSSTSSSFTVEVMANL